MVSEHDEPKTALTRLLGQHRALTKLIVAAGEAWIECLCGERVTVDLNAAGPYLDRAFAAHLADVLLAEGYTTSPAPEATETVEHLQARLDDETAARRIAGGAADRFRDVLSECLGHADENPGDDVLVTELRQHFGKTGPEPTRWRNFLTGARAVMDQINAMPDPWVPVDRAADEHEEGP